MLLARDSESYQQWRQHLLEMQPPRSIAYQQWRQHLLDTLKQQQQQQQTTVSDPPTNLTPAIDPSTTTTTANVSASASASTTTTSDSDLQTTDNKTKNKVNDAYAFTGMHTIWCEHIEPGSRTPPTIPSDEQHQRVD
jgi:YesN/AraC family two-component response regulator